MIKFLRYFISAIIGFWLVHYLELEGFIVIFFFFGIYIAISILLEIIRKIFTPKNSNKEANKN